MRSGSCHGAIGVGVAALDLVNMLHAFNHGTHHGVLTVQKVAIGKHDEELRIGGIGVLRAGHAHRAAHERLVGKFGRQIRLRRPAHACAAGRETIFHVAELDIAGLGHEALDHPVKGNIVILAGIGKRLEPSGVVRCHVIGELDDHITSLERDGQLLGCRCKARKGQRESEKCCGDKTKRRHESSGRFWTAGPSQSGGIRLTYCRALCNAAA